MPVPLHGQIAVSGTAQVLQTPPVITSAYTIKAHAANANPVYLGASTVSTANGYQLSAGETFEYEHREQAGNNVFAVGLGDLYVVGTAGTDRISWLASP